MNTIGFEHLFRRGACVTVVLSLVLAATGFGCDDASCPAGTQEVNAHCLRQTEGPGSQGDSGSTHETTGTAGFSTPTPPSPSSERSGAGASGDRPDSRVSSAGSSPVLPANGAFREHSAGACWRPEPVPVRRALSPPDHGSRGRMLDPALVPAVVSLLDKTVRKPNGRSAMDRVQPR